MNYLSVENLTKTFGERTLFQNLTFGIDQGEKVALVAKNGTGKSTLLKCLLGQEPYDDGRVVFNNDITVSFLQQSDDLNDNHTILEEVFNHDLPKLQVFSAYAKAVREKDEEKIAALFEQVSEHNAWDLESKVEQMLSKLKLDDSDRLISTLSGGQRKRVALAKVLIAEPDLLFLDEPTNHLDLDMIEWLEEYLSQSKSTIFMVTHDRYFLEVITDVIFELDNQELFRYKGNFSYFLENKAEREELLATEIQKAKSQYRKELTWMRRQPKARGTKQKARIEAFHETKKVAGQRIDEDELEIPVKMERLGTKILELHGISKSYGDIRILNQFDYNFGRKERLGIVGPNGAGKSTFLKMIMGEEAVDTGKVVIGETVVFGYYSQENIQVDNEKKVIDVIREVADFIPLEKGREMSAAQFLEKFLFPRSMHYDYVYKLSGGEKRRLKLMKVLMMNPNFLILDEPTNDLDIYIMSVLEDYLIHYPGCLIVVSHDRYFMDKMVDHLFVFDGEGEIVDISGNYSAYRAHQEKLKKQQQAEVREKREEKEKIVKVKSEPKEKDRLSYKEQREFEALDEEIVELEEEKEQLTEVLSAGTVSPDELNEASKRLGELMGILEEKTERWMYLAEFA